MLISFPWNDFKIYCYLSSSGSLRKVERKFEHQDNIFYNSYCSFPNFEIFQPLYMLKVGSRKMMIIENWKDTVLN